jgi:hemicentin
VTSTDNGSYTFEARNAAGSGMATVTLTVTSGKPSITSHPNNAQVNAGSTVNFSCTADAYPEPEFTWKFGTTVLTSHEDIAISSPTGNDPYTSTLTLKDVKTSDAGSYSCSVANMKGTVSSQTANLTVYVKPDVSAVSSTVEERLGATVVLQVTVTKAFPDVVNQDKIWKKGGKELTSAKYSFSSDRLILTIKSLVDEDAGDYTFTASNRAGSDTATITVRVQGRPVITQQPTFNPNPVNETGTLIGTCKANATGSNPQPSSFKWYKDDMELSTGGRITISATNDSGDFVGTLTINGVMNSDEGSYTCTAFSSAGNISSVSVEIEVQIAPKISVSPTEHKDVEGDIEKSDFLLTITNADVVNPDIKPTDIIWRYEGSVINENEGYRFIGANERIIIPVKESFAGQYSVEVTNAAGRAIALFSLTVLVPARIERFLSNLTVNETDSFNLNCTAHGKPTPQISLYWADQKLRSSETESGNALNGNPYIAYTVAQSKGSNSGTYRCAAENDVKLGINADLRRSERTVRVTVNVAPHIDIPTQSLNMSVIDGSVLFLHCSATGTPLPTYTWTLDGQEINTAFGYSLFSNGTLKIERIKLEDAGDYVCMASNFLGSPASSAQIVTVYVEPFIIFPPQSFILNLTTPSEINIGCIAGGIPEPRIEWHRDIDEIVTTGDKYDLRGDTERESSKDVFRVFSNLTIKNPTTDDTRPYICSSITGPPFQDVISDVTIHVIVLVAPMFTSSPKNVTVLQTQEVFFQCISSAAPVSTIEWRMNEIMLPPNSRNKVTKSSVKTSSIQGRPFITTSNLTITNSKYTDAGVYSCHAVNAVGETDSSSAVLVVQVAPQVSSHPISKTRNMSDSVVFCCTSTGVPAPDITWKTTGQAPISLRNVTNSVSGTDSILYTTTSDLEVKNLQKSYDGNFTCTSSNGIEMPSVSRPALLTVQGKSLQSS